LDRAAATLSCELVRGQTTLRWAGPRERSDCQHAIRVAKNEEAYEVGLVPAEGQEGWLLIYDDWQGGFGLEAALGKNLSLLLMHYQLERAKLQAEALGY